MVGDDGGGRIRFSLRSLIIAITACSLAFGVIVWAKKHGVTKGQAESIKIGMTKPEVLGQIGEPHNVNRWREDIETWEYAVWGWSDALVIDFNSEEKVTGIHP